ncbi:hypothetical protein ACHQM5_014946 [Ranunculus cassubicifolius]
MAKRSGGTKGKVNGRDLNGRKKRLRKNQATEAKVVRSSPTPSISGNSSEEDLPSKNLTSEEVRFVKEPSMYDNLLTTLGSGNAAFADIYRKRQREEEGRSDTEDEEIDSESPSPSGDDEESEEETGLQDSDQADFMALNNGAETEDEDGAETEDEGGAETEDEDETSGSDHNNDVDKIGQTTRDSSKGPSSFDAHLGHIITQVEVDDLAKRKWSYKWAVPAVDMPMSKWVGTGECFLKESNDGSHWGTEKNKLRKHWHKLDESSGSNESSRRSQFFSLCNSYRDILHCNKRPFYLKGSDEDSKIMDAYIMHVLNHLSETRDLLNHNDARLAKLRENNNEESLSGDGGLDHGFTRPKVLIMLPMKSIAHRVIRRLLQLAPSAQKGSVLHIDRFSDEYGTEDVKDDDDENDISNTALPEKSSRSQKSSKPSDFQALFGGNNEDHFMMGIKFTRRSIKLYSDFYSSDIIVASPLALITKIEAAKVNKEKDVDYLSSIEILIIDHADVIAMQNWSHVTRVFENLNHIPSKQHGTDVMRIRQWYLDGNARFYRQTIMLGAFLNPDMNSLFNHHCHNYIGKVKMATEYKGVLSKVILPVRQVYERFDVASFMEADDTRLDYFAKKIFPKIKNSDQGGTMIFISSYFEFVRVRNFLKSQNSSFCLLGEYSKSADISRARVWFFNGDRNIMLYSERAHFYHRYKIRGMKNLIIYSLPERKEFYPEIVNMIEGSEELSCTVLFSQFDKLRLERVVGTSHAKRLISSEKSIFVFC